VFTAQYGLIPYIKQIMFRLLKVKQPGSYLNFRTLFMKNILVEYKKVKLRNKQHFVENKPDIMQHVLEMKYTSWLYKYIR